MTDQDKQIPSQAEETPENPLPPTAPSPSTTTVDPKAMATPESDSSEGTAAVEAIEADVLGEEATGNPPSFDDLELDEPSTLLAEIEGLKQKLQQMETQLEQRTDQYVRISADFENFRKRTRKEKEELEQAVKCSTVLEILPVVDNFERAKDQLKPQSEEGGNVHKSYQGIYKQFVECLKRIGVAPMRAEGQPFDPMLHDAMLREPTDQHEEGIVMQELQRGYLLGERVLRHAMVKVAAPLEPMVPSEGSPNDEVEEALESS
jgi:molecular chaperone GrpE